MMDVDDEEESDGSSEGLQYAEYSSTDDTNIGPLTSKKGMK